MNTLIVVLSYNRSKYFQGNYVTTWDSVGTLENTVLGLRSEEKERYPYAEKHIYFENVTNIAETRQACVHYAAQRGIARLIMLDDDLRFYTTKFNVASIEEATKYLLSLAEYLDEYPVLTTPNIMTIRRKNIHLRPSRIMWAHAINVEWFTQNKLTYVLPGLPMMEDFYVSFQAASLGFPPRTFVTDVFLTEVTRRRDGGVQTHNRMEELQQCAYTLHSMFPEYTRLVYVNKNGRHFEDIRCFLGGGL